MSETRREALNRLALKYGHDPLPPKSFTAPESVVEDYESQARELLNKQKQSWSKLVSHYQSKLSVFNQHKSFFNLSVVKQSVAQMEEYLKDKIDGPRETKYQSRYAQVGAAKRFLGMMEWELHLGDICDKTTAYNFAPSERLLQMRHLAIQEAELYLQNAQAKSSEMEEMLRVHKQQYALDAKAFAKSNSCWWRLGVFCCGDGASVDRESVAGDRPGYQRMF